MAQHFTAHVKITKTIEKEEDTYGKVTRERSVEDVTEFTVRGLTYQEIEIKVNAMVEANN